MPRAASKSGFGAFPDMADPKVRREIAARAAQLMYVRQESEYFTAKRKAAKEIVGSDRLRDLPSNAEIRGEILLLAEMMEGSSRLRELEAMRLLALRFLRMLERWKPRLIGSVLTGHIRRGSDIDIHVFCDAPGAVADLLGDEGYECEIERKRVLKHHEERVFNHIHVRAKFPVELTVYASDKASYPFKSSITGRTIERADAAGLEALLLKENPAIDLASEMAATDVEDDPLELFAALLRPLESVTQDRRWHPEGDALYHSLQVFELARAARPYDQEFVLAALLHDVGKAIDRSEHVRAGVEALRDAVTERTLWLIEHHMEAHEYRDGTLGARARRRLEESPDFEDLMLLSELDRAGRVPGAAVASVDEAIAWIDAMEQ